MSGKSFVHAHVHTDYSALDGAAKVNALVEKVVELGQPGVAITDHGNAQGTHELWKVAKEHDINAILGQEFYVAPFGYSRSHRAPVFYGDSGGEDPKERSIDVSGGGAYTHMTIWAENNEGKFNLFKLSTRAYLEGKYMKPRIDTELLSEHSRGLIGTTGCPSGEIQTRLRLGQWDKAIEYASQMQDILGKDNYYCEIMDHGLEIERMVKADLLRLAKELRIPLIATNDSHYVSSDQVESHDHLLCISSGSTLNSEKRFKFSGDSYYIKSSEEMRDLFRDHPEACDNTLELNERCNVSFDEDADLMPKFDVPQGTTDKEFLEKEVIRLIPERVSGWDKMTKEKQDSYFKQAEYECGVINLMGFASYFLVVSDFVQWAKDNGIAVGPGRGCLSFANEVITPNGYVPISTVKAGDEVLDEDGNIVIVPQTFAYPVEEKLTKLSLENGTETTLTTDHKVLVKKPNAYGDNDEWVKAKEVNVGDSMIILDPKMKERTYNKVLETGVEDYTGEVYDFTIPTTHSYQTRSGIVHNSAGGCLVAYALSITELDPIRHGLIFERFLNPDRVSMPDIDIDFDDKRRAEVIEYVTNKYGQDKVSQIITYTMMKAKSALKDATRILDYPYSLGDTLSKKFPPDVNGRGMKLSEIFDPNHERYPEAEEFRTFVNKGTAIFGPEMCKRVIEVALGIEGFLRTTGIHAAGVLMSSQPIAGIIPLMDPSTADKETSKDKKDKKDKKKEEEEHVLTTVTQYDYPTCESLGLLKMDFLGLRNLTIITDAVNSVKANHGVDISLTDMIHSDLDDKKTYELLQRGDASGIFQLESSGMRSLLRNMAPTAFDDIVAVLALYRPGPMGMDAHIAYADRKNGRAPVRPIHPELEEPLKDILGETFGLCVAGDTKVWNANTNTLVRIDSIQNEVDNGDFYTYSVNENTGKVESKQVTHWFYTGEKEIYEITTQSRKRIRVSADHPVLTPEGYKKAGELVVDELVATVEKDSVEWSQINSIIVRDIEPVYDITVEDNHNFLANGVVVHNCIYQEQIMQIAQKVAGYSLSQADILRRAMGKKKKSELDKQEDAFRSGMKERGYSQEAFQALWDTLLPFADYAFNKSHSAGYALLSYVTAYLKAHYPEEYMAALLTSVSTKPEQTALYLNECKKMGIEVTPPSIIASEKNYSPKIKQIVFGLNSVRGLGGQTVDDLLKYRDGDKYDNIPTLLEHIPVGALNKKVFEGLIFGGALDVYGHNRRSLEDSLIPMLSNIKKRRTEQEDGQVSLFDAYEVELPKIIIPDLPEYPKREKLSKERHILGLYLSDHPLSSMGETLESHSDRTIIDIITNPPAESSDFGAGEKTVIAGVVTSTTEKTTRKGEKMLLATIEDVTGEIETIAFPKTYSAMGPMFQDDIYKVSGTVRNEEDRGISMIVDSYELLEIDEETGKVPLWLKMYEGEATEDAVKELKAVLKKSSGDTPVRVSMKRPDGSVMNIRLGTEYSVKSSPVFAQRLMALFGSKIFGKWG